MKPAVVLSILLALLSFPAAAAAPDLPDAVGPCAVTTGFMWPGTLVGVTCAVDDTEVVHASYGWRSLGWTCPVRVADGAVSANPCHASAYAPAEGPECYDVYSERYLVVVTVYQYSSCSYGVAVHPEEIWKLVTLP